MSRDNTNLVRRGLGALALSVTMLAGLSGCWPQAPEPKAKVTINGKTEEIDVPDLKDLDKEFDKAFDKALKNAKDKTGKGKIVIKDKAASDILNPGNKKTDPSLTAKVHLVPLADKGWFHVRPLRGRKDLIVVVKTTLKFPTKPGDQGSNEYVFSRVDPRNGKVYGPWTRSLATTRDHIEDVSPDGGLVAIRDFHGMDLTVVSLADGKIIANTYKPSYTSTGPGGAKNRIGATALRFLDSNRWLVLYHDGAVDVWTNGSAWKRKQVRPPTPIKREVFSTRGPTDWCVSNDSKTAAFWNGVGFDLIDTTTGEARGKTAALELQGDEKSFQASSALFSPDGTHLLVKVIAPKKRGSNLFAASFSVSGKDAPVRVNTNSVSNLFWWGNKHVFSHGNKNFSLQGKVFDATTGKELADFAHAGSLVMDNPDGKLRIVQDGEGGKKVLVQCTFPKKLVSELEKRAGGGKLGVLQANKTGVGIRP
jgi:hypothetical protein